LLPLVLAAVLLCAVGPGDGIAAAGKNKLDPKLKVHPLLQVGAEEEPEKKVRVLVVKDGKDKSRKQSQDIARTAEAAEFEDFSFADSQAMEIKQKHVLKLANRPDVRYIAPDGPVGGPVRQPGKKGTAVTQVGREKTAPAMPPPDGKALATAYPFEVNADKVWNSNTLRATGKGVTVAVIDTGVNAGHPAFAGSNLISVTVNKRALGTQDTHGHGTHVVGIINGRDAADRYVGVAPDARVISVKVADDAGAANESDLLRGMQWVYDNRHVYNIRAVNISMSSAVAASYTTSPVAAAAEQLWFGGVVVVAAAGNHGTAPNATWYAPGNDPFVISVGCVDDRATKDTGDDRVCEFGSRGKSQDGFYRPDVMAPGRRIVSALAGPSSTLALQYPERVTDGDYIRMSGTSGAAPVVTGVVALLLERYPNLTPNQVKHLLVAQDKDFPSMRDGRGIVDALKAITAASQNRLGTANAGLTPSRAIDPTTGAISQSQTYWDQTYWDQTYWDQTYWDQTYWDQAAGYD
jgi:serine protease AprX